jgi:hypothetical protein
MLMLNRLRAQKLLGVDKSGERMGLLKGTHTHIYVYIKLYKYVYIYNIFFDQPNDIIWVQKNRVYPNEQTSSSILWGVSIQFEFVQKSCSLSKIDNQGGGNFQFLSLIIVGF